MQRAILATSFVVFCAFSVKGVWLGISGAEVTGLGAAALVTCFFGALASKKATEVDERIESIEHDLVTMKQLVQDTKDQVSTVSVGQSLTRRR